MAISSESRLLDARTELETLRNDFDELKRVDEGRCAESVHLQSVVANLIHENRGLKRRLKMHNFGTILCGLFVICTSVFIRWFL